jgi:hypothetical protein
MIDSDIADITDTPTSPAVIVGCILKKLYPVRGSFSTKDANDL